jgi:hypothetical protein
VEHIEKMNNNNNNNNRGNRVVKANVGNKLTSPPLSVYFNSEENDFYHIDIEFYGVDVSGPSYQGRVYVNNPDANENTPLDEKNRNVGSYYIFGHYGCFGDEGHCELPTRRPYDSRSKIDVKPCYKSIEATKVLKKYIQSGKEIVLTIVPLISKAGRKTEIDTKDVVHIQRIRINCYENALKLVQS